jgi:S-adenosylmethionine hydrolase
MSRPLIALLSDFGLRDHYVAAMKGVVLGICPEATLVDISHDVAPHDVLGGALELAASYRYFPAGCIFLVVIDPGVGSRRRAIGVEAGVYRFVAPDNGVLAPLVAELPAKRVVELSERRYARPTVSRTFEGRDRFAPAAAWLAKGVDLAALGRPVSAIEPLQVPRAAVSSEGIDGEVLRVDRFGNLVTNIDRGTFDRAAAEGPVELTVAGVPVRSVVSTYADAPAGGLCALFGSSDDLEIALNGASAASALGAGRGAAVQVRRARA